MKNILIIFIALNSNLLLAEENSQRELRLIGKVLPVTSSKIYSDEKMVSIETSSNLTYATERQKFFLTNVENMKVDLKTQLLAKANGTMKHEVIVKYIEQLNQTNKPIIFNIQAN